MKSQIKMFLDDVRKLSDNSWIVCEIAEAAIAAIRQQGWSEISFDCALRTVKTGYDTAKSIEMLPYNNELETAQKQICGIKMTEKHAALVVYNLWSWLEANPDAGKRDYPLFDELRIKESLDMCPWCELFRIRFTMICSDCPLDRAYSNCFLDGSIFDCWNRRSRRSVAAGEIARIAWREYKRFGG